MLPFIIESTIDKLYRSLRIHTRQSIQDILNTHEFICLNVDSIDFPFVGYKCKKCNYSLADSNFPGNNFKIHTCDEWIIKNILE